MIIIKTNPNCFVSYVYNVKLYDSPYLFFFLFF